MTSPNGWLMILTTTNGYLTEIQLLCLFLYLIQSHYDTFPNPSKPVEFPFLPHPLISCCSPLPSFICLPHPFPHTVHSNEETLCPQICSAKHPFNLPPPQYQTQPQFPPAFWKPLWLSYSLKHTMQVFRPLFKSLFSNGSIIPSSVPQFFLSESWTFFLYSPCGILAVLNTAVSLSPGELHSNSTCLVLLACSLYPLLNIGLLTGSQGPCS